MNKTTPEIAKALLERRNRMSFVVLPGELTSEIGPDGVAEALSKRWLVPDTDNGFLLVSHDLGTIAEMRKIADMKPEQFAQQVLPVAESHNMAMLHARRSHSIHEVAAPMTGAPSPGLSTVGQPQPQQPQAPGQSAGSPAGYQVGTAVTVARQGVKASGVIERLHPDGRFQVGFQADQTKPPGDNIFGKDEVSVVPTSPQRPPPGPLNPNTGELPH